MKIYAQLNNSLFIVDWTAKGVIPDGFVEMKTERPSGDWHAKSDGKWHKGDPDKEIMFIESECALIAEQLLMHEDEDGDAIATAQELRDYRKSLRRWNWDNEHFPDPQYRPKRPS